MVSDKGKKLDKKASQTFDGSKATMDLMYRRIEEILKSIVDEGEAVEAAKKAPNAGEGSSKTAEDTSKEPENTSAILDDSDSDPNDERTPILTPPAPEPHPYAGTGFGVNGIPVLRPTMPQRNMYARARYERRNQTPLGYDESSSSTTKPKDDPTELAKILQDDLSASIQPRKSDLEMDNDWPRSWKDGPSTMPARGANESYMGDAEAAYDREYPRRVSTMQIPKHIVDAGKAAAAEKKKNQRGWVPRTAHKWEDEEGDGDATPRPTPKKE